MFIDKKSFTLDQDILLRGFTFRDLLDTTNANGDSIDETFNAMLNEACENARELVELHRESLERIRGEENEY